MSAPAARSCALAVSLALSLGGCAASHVKTYEPKRRDYQPPVAVAEAPPPRDDGSIWGNRVEGSTLFTDVRAFRVNDLVTVQIQERATAQRDTGTAVGRDGSVALGGDVLGLVGEAGDAMGFDPQRLLEARSESRFGATGKTSRRDDVRFTVAATVTKVLPNGNLFIEGHRVVLVNEEEHHFYISGVARPEDINRDNAISSIQLADAHVEFTGSGTMSEGQRPGWLTRILNYINPL